MKVLGLDLSLKGTGACILDGGDTGEPTARRTFLYLRPHKLTEIRAKIERLVSIAEDVVGLVEEEHPDHIIIEAPAKNQKWQAAAIGEIHGVIKVQIFLATGIIPLIKESTQMRAAVVGKIPKVQEIVEDKKGKKKKRWNYGMIPGKRGGLKKATIKDIIEVILRERGLEFPSQDEMDAYVAARYCWDGLVSSMEKVVDEKEKTENARAQSGAS
jgi:Holliday junction resolvasome RuvABC endonuclease subunit